MKRAGPMLALSLVIAMVVVACASMRGDGRDHVARAVQAQGGTDAMAKVKTISQKGTVRSSMRTGRTNSSIRKPWV